VVERVSRCHPHLKFHPGSPPRCSLSHLQHLTSPTTSTLTTLLIRLSNASSVPVHRAPPAARHTTSVIRQTSKTSIAQLAPQDHGPNLHRRRHEDGPNNLRSALQKKGYPAETNNLPLKPIPEPEAHSVPHLTQYSEYHGEPPQLFYRLSKQSARPTPSLLIRAKRTLKCLILSVEVAVGVDRVRLMEEYVHKGQFQSPNLHRRLHAHK
jgi:hypothetical protein